MSYCTSISLKKPTPFLQFDRFYFVVGAGLLLFWCWVTFGWFQEPKLSQSSFYPQVYLLEFELHLTTVGRRCPAWNPHHHSSTTVLDSWLEGWGFKWITLTCSWKYTNLEYEAFYTLKVIYQGCPPSPHTYQNVWMLVVFTDLEQIFCGTRRWKICFNMTLVNYEATPLYESCSQEPGGVVRTMV